MTFPQFKLSYYSFLIIFRLLILVVLGLWVKNSIYYFQTTNFIDLILDLDRIGINKDKIWEISKDWLIDTFWVMVRVATLQIIIWIVKRIPVHTKWIATWDNLGDISPIFGRSISSHFRYNNSINFMTIIHIYNNSQYQMALLNMHHQNENLRQIFRKYDPLYAIDSKNMKIQPPKPVRKEAPKEEVKEDKQEPNLD